MPTEHDKQQYPLYLYEFRYRCERSGKWRKARYRAEVHEIQSIHAEFEIIGEPMVIHGPAETFSPYRRANDRSRGVRLGCLRGPSVRNSSTSSCVGRALVLVAAAGDVIHDGSGRCAFPSCFLVES